jgi:predicted O-methyltransferase YrrM
MKSILTMPCPPQEFETEVYYRLSRSDVEYSEMPEIERLFINGLIRYARPSNILEIGVARGGGSVVLLNAISDMPNGKVTSVDTAVKYYRDHSFNVGCAASKKYPDSPRWELRTGKDISEIIEELAQDRKFDMVVLDTLHVHPAETLHFLSVFPFLTDDAIIVIQDLQTYASTLAIGSVFYRPFHLFPNIAFACKLLYDTLVGDKIKLPVSEYAGSRWNIHYSNLGAVQLNADSRKYLGDVFSVLEFPWGILLPAINHVSSIVYKYYKKAFAEQYKVGPAKRPAPHRQRIFSKNAPEVSPSN